MFYAEKINKHICTPFLHSATYSPFFSSPLILSLKHFSMDSNTKHTKGLLLESASWSMRINVGDME